MVKTISISDDVYARLEALSRPFEDRAPEDVIRRLLDCGSTNDVAKPSGGRTTSELAVVRTPRERGTVVELNGDRISATTVPDLCAKVMEFIYAKGLWNQFEGLAPYRTSAKRYLFAKTPKHPQGNDFFVQLKYKNIYMEAHKNYETTIKQLGRLLFQLGITFKYIR
jgi:predicted CopG family antitoxin